MAVPALKLTANDIKRLNDWEGYFRFKETSLWTDYIHSACRVKAFFTGNQFGKDATIARSLVLRVSGNHPVAERNFDFLVCNPDDIWEGHRFSIRYRGTPHWKYGKIGADCPVCGKELKLYCSPYRIFRCASEHLPGQTDDGGKGGNKMEIKNTQYPELLKWMPSGLIKKGITAKSPLLTIKDPNGGSDIGFEFVSYNQTSQAQAGVQRAGIWYSEHAPFQFYTENNMRFLQTGGDVNIGLTPALYMNWEYDELFCKAKYFYRTGTIAKLLNVPLREKTDSTSSIAIFQAASDDNPMSRKENIDAIFADIDDPDELMIRRYGVFKQVSGTIHKGFQYNVHVINGTKWFPDGLPHTYLHSRGIDYHARVKWAFNAMALSPQNELFVYLELDPDPTKLITYEIARMIAKMCGDYRYAIDRIDPLASEKQTNTGRSTVEDLNKYFLEFKRHERLGTGGNWYPWDTKGLRGREAFQQRIHNSNRVMKPFNNEVTENGRTVHLPTVWFFDTCPATIKSVKQWRWEERQAGAEGKDAKESPEQKFSHHNMVIECLLKETGMRPRYNEGPLIGVSDRDANAPRKGYFSQGARV